MLSLTHITHVFGQLFQHRDHENHSYSSCLGQLAFWLSSVATAPLHRKEMAAAGQWGDEACTHTAQRVAWSCQW
jgi:hypothetical protein